MIKAKPESFDECQDTGCRSCGYSAALDFSKWGYWDNCEQRKLFEKQEEQT